MVKTRSCDAPPKKAQPKFAEAAKSKRSAKRRRQIDSEEEEAPNPALFTYKTKMIPYEEESFDPQDCIANLQPDAASREEGEDDFESMFGKLEVIEIMEHRPDSEDDSEAETENKMSQSESKQRMSDFDSQFGFTVLHKMATHTRNREDLDISCDSDDVEIEGEAQARIEAMRKMRKITPESSDSQPIPNLNQEPPVAPIPDQQADQPVLEAAPDGLVFFGPPNIDDLSTQGSLNAHSEQQPPSLHHIFMEIGNNIFENLSESSTKACMSHVDQEPVEPAVPFPTEEDYNQMLWEISQSQERVQLSYAEKLVRVCKYLEMMTKHVEERALCRFNREEWSQFWRILMELKVEMGDHYCVTLMVHFACVFERVQPESGQFLLEYEFIRARLLSMRLVCGPNQYGSQTVPIRILLKDYLNM